MQVTIEGFDILGDDDTWAGIRMFGTRDLISIQNNFIHGMADENPNSNSFSYSYGIWGLGGGTVGSRGSLSHLSILYNRIYDLGGASLPSGHVSGGAGIFLFSLLGNGSGTGALISENQFADLANGTHILWPQPGLGVALMQDDDSGRIDTGGQILLNTYENLFMGAVMHTDDSFVVETAAAFTNVEVLVKQLDGLGGVNETSLAPFNKRDDEHQLVLPAVGISSTAYYPINQTRYVDDGGTDSLNLCTNPANPCRTIQWAVDRSFAGDTIQVLSGTYAESVSVDKAITINGAKAGISGVGRLAGAFSESILDASGFPVGFSITSDGVEIDGFDIKGDASTWTGVKMFAATDGVTIQNNLIHGLSNSNPNSLRYSYSYGVWAVGGGTVPSRGAITGLQILNNRIFDLGGSAVYNGFSGGAGVFVFSTVGATAGAGVIVTGNRLEDLPGGTHNVYGTQPGLGVAVLSDESGADDTGGLVTGNSYINIPMGVTMQVGNSTVSETNASFSGATVFVLNISSLAVIDEISLQPYASSTSPSLGFFSAPSGSIAYFPSAQAAFDNSTSAATVTIHGNLSGVGTATATRIFLDGGQMVIVQNGVEIFRGTPGGVTSVVVLGTSGNDTLEINLDLLGLIGASGIVFNAGLGFDSITLVGGTGLTTVEHVFENENDGRVEVDGNLIVTYTGLDPIIDLLVAVNRIFTFTAGSETVVMSDDGIIGNGFSFIDGDSAESVTYRNPSATLVVNLGLGNDTVTLTELDSGLTIDPVLNGNAGNDRFNITPSANYNVFVFGGTPTVAPGDALDIDLAGATGAVLTNLGGTGNWSFTNRETIFFQEIETQIDDPTQTDLAISKWMSSSTAIAGDIVVFTVAVTNNGVATASGVEVTDVLPATLTCICAEVISEGAFGSTGGSGATLTWSGVGLASGETATLSYQVLVGLAASGTGTNTATITAVSPADVNPLDNSATASITFDRPIRFPTNTVVQAIDFYVNALGVVETFVGTHNAGLYRNIPGYIGGRWTLVEDDLPTNLFVNDILVSSSGITYVATAGWGGLHTSSNGGRSYTPVDFGGPTLTTVYAIDESPVDGTIFISADDGQVWRLVGGAYWDFAGRLPGGASHTPWTFATDPTVAGRVYAGTFGDGVYRSNDYGESWTKVSGPAMPNDGSIHVFDLEFDPELSPSTLWAGTSRGIFFSQDSGVTWNDASSGLGQFKEVRSIAFGPEDSSPTETGSMYVATWGGGVFELPSDRSTLPLWVPVTLRNQQIGIVAVSPDGTSLVVGPAGGGTETVAIGSSVSTSADKPVEIPSAVSLNQNYPNPFNPRTTISFGLPASGRVTLTVHDVVGRQVATLIDGVVPGGQHEVGFNAGALPSGPYIYRLRTEAGSLDKVMLLLK